MTLHFYAIVSSPKIQYNLSYYDDGQIYDVIFINLIKKINKYKVLIAAESPTNLI